MVVKVEGMEQEEAAVEAVAARGGAGAAGPPEPAVRRGSSRRAARSAAGPAASRPAKITRLPSHDAVAEPDGDQVDGEQHRAAVDAAREQHADRLPLVLPVADPLQRIGPRFP